MIVDELLAVALPLLKGRVVVDLRIGLSYTAALLDDGNLGVASSLPDWSWRNCTCTERAGQLTGAAQEIAELVRNCNTLDVSAGLAVINAVLNPRVEGESGDMVRALGIRGGENVAMIGYFAPVARKIEGRCNLMVFERRYVGEGVYPDWCIEQLVPQADIVILSSTSLVNKTADRILRLPKAGARVAMAGPTTAMCAEVFSPHGVSVLAGMQFVDPVSALAVIGQGGGTQRFSRFARKITLELDH